MRAGCARQRRGARRRVSEGAGRPRDVRDAELRFADEELALFAFLALRASLKQRGRRTWPRGPRVPVVLGELSVPRFAPASGRAPLDAEQNLERMRLVARDVRAGAAAGGSSPDAWSGLSRLRTEWRADIDERVYRLYGISQPERAIVEAYLARS